MTGERRTQSIRFSDEDKQLIAQLQAHYGVSSVSAVVLMALRALAREAGILPKSQSQE